MDYSLCMLVLLTTLSSVSPGQFPTSQIIKDWVFQIQKDLITLTDKASGLEDLIKIYHKHKTHFSVESNNARKLVATAAGNIEKLLDNRSEALKRLATEAEKFQKEHEWTVDGEASELKYYNAKDGVNKTALKEREKDKDKEEDKSNRFIPDDFEIDPDFKRLVSYNTTAVHIPTDIYEGLTSSKQPARHFTDGSVYTETVICSIIQLGLDPCNIEVKGFSSAC